MVMDGNTHFEFPATAYQEKGNATSTKTKARRSAIGRERVRWSQNLYVCHQWTNNPAKKPGSGQSP